MGVSERSPISRMSRLLTVWRATGSSPSKVSSQNRYSQPLDSAQMMALCRFIPLEKVWIFCLSDSENASRSLRKRALSKRG